MHIARAGGVHPRSVGSAAAQHRGEGVGLFELRVIVAHHAQAEAVGGHVDQDAIDRCARQEARLDRGAEGDREVGIDLLVDVDAERVSEPGPAQGRDGRSTS